MPSGVGASVKADQACGDAGRRAVKDLEANVPGREVNARLTDRQVRGRE